MTDNFTYWHLDGTQCVVGWDGHTGECVKGGGPVTPRVFEEDIPTTVEKVKVLMVGYWDLTRVEPVGLFTDEHSASLCLRWWMKNRKMPSGFYSVQPYHIGQQYGVV